MDSPREIALLCLAVAVGRGVRPALDRALEGLDDLGAAEEARRAGK